jgi:hypothetical protein
MTDQALQLPDGWDNSRDIVLIVGENSAASLAPFVNHGIKRIVALFPEPLQPEAVPEGVTTIQTEAELNSWVMKLPKPAKHIRVGKTPSCSVDTAVINRFMEAISTSAQKSRDFLVTLFDLAPFWAKNGIRNTHFIATRPMIGDVGDAFKGVPMIIVGAGPSLAKNIEVLKQAQGKAIIVAVNRTLRSLQNAGIYPDFTIALEPRDVLCQFEGIAMGQISGVLLATSVNRNLYELEDASTVSYYNNEVLDGWMLDPEDQRHEASSMGTVSHSAFTLGVAWGCDPIMLVGHDLSFPGGKYYHKDGADGDTEVVIDPVTGESKLSGFSEDITNTMLGAAPKGFQAVEVPGFYGGMVPTSPSFSNFREWFEQLTELHGKDHRLVNCTEGGCFIQGMEHLALAEVMAGLPAHKPDVRAVLAQAESSKAVVERSQRMRRRHVAMTRDLGIVADLSKKCLRLIDKAMTKPQFLGLLSQAEAQLKPAAAKIQALNLATQEAIKAAVGGGGEIKTVRDSLRFSKKLYTIIFEQARLLHREAQAVLDTWPETPHN